MINKTSKYQNQVKKRYPFFRIAKKLHSTQNWAKPPNFIHPVSKSRFWGHYHMRASNSPKFMQVAKQGNSLQCFTKTLKSKKEDGGIQS